MAWEFSLLYELQKLHNEWMDPFMIFITKLGDGGLLWIVIGILLLCKKKTRRTGLQVLISMLVTLIVGNFVLKNIFARLRPCDLDTTIAMLIPRPNGYSFPSGHSMNSMTAAMTIFIRDRKLGIPALFFAVMMGFSRLYHFVHFPTDVLGGFVVGIGIALLVNYVFQRKLKVENS